MRKSPIPSGSTGAGPRHSDVMVLQSDQGSNGEEGIMGIVMIRCPSTGGVVSTGIETAGVEQLPTVIATTVCSACGRVHEWTKHDVWLAEGGEHYRKAVAAS